MADARRDELQQAARHLLQHPFTCAEHDLEMFALIRRHEQTLDRWYTQRLGYRLQVTSFTARLFKATLIPRRPYLMAPVSSNRPMSQRECTLLVLILAAVAAGPRVISLRDLIDDVRSQATDADIILSNESIERRAFVIALKWMISHGLAKELHEHIDRYEQDDNADAVLEIDPDRIGLLPLPALGRAQSAEQLLDRTHRRANTRQWLRARLTEDPVLYRSDVTDHEWSELRRRLGEDMSLLDEMFGVQLESRAEGVVAVDAEGKLSDIAFPAGGTVGHAALLFIEKLLELPNQCCTKTQARQLITDMAEENKRHWSKVQVENPASLLREVTQLLIDQRLLSYADDVYALQPAAARYDVDATVKRVTGTSTDDPQQSSLW